MKHKSIDFVTVSTNRERLRSLCAVLRHELDEVSYETTNLYKAAAARRFRARLDKRMASLVDDNIRHHSINLFHNVNRAASEVSPDIPSPILNGARNIIIQSLEEFSRRQTGAIQCELDYGLLLSLWRFGPGASRLSGPDTSFLSKLSGPQSVTISALPFVKQMIQFMTRYQGSYAQDSRFTIVEGSRLSFVPKNQNAERTICTEPLWNMAIQLAAGGYIEGALRTLGLDISTQEDKNKSLARKGSIDGSLATIDLSMASDLITPQLIRLLWPPSWFMFLSAIRSPQTILPDGSEHQLHMMSTMGNGFTFPMMTLTLFALVKATCEHIRCKTNEIAVYGDDIICPSRAYDAVVDTLRAAGLVVNLDKSYSEGLFRESCGGDYLDGYDITPPYPRSLISDAQTYIVINQIIDWCSTHQLFLDNTLRCLRGFLSSKPLFVPEWESAFAGIRTTMCSGRYTRLQPILTMTSKRIHKFDYEKFISAAVGGYIASSGYDRFMYSKRAPQGTPLRTYIDRRVAFPQGYTTGRDPLSRGPMESKWAELLVAEMR